MRFKRDERGNIRCPFCGRYPMSIKDMYPEARDKLACSTGFCPGGGVWVDPERWNTRVDIEALDRMEGKSDE